MPYRTSEELPLGVRRNLPPHALEIYREAFNNAWEQYGGERRQEEIAHRVAWAAVKRCYRKVDGIWTPK